GAEDIENGFFTLSLLEALDENDSKADADQDGVLSFWEMTDYVSKRTDELARVCYRESQNPNLSGSIVNFALLDGLLIDGIKKSEWNKANAIYQEACVLRRQKKWREALAKIRGARKINEKRDEYKTAEAEIQAQVDATVASEKRAEADKLAADAWKAFDLGGEANVGEAIRLMKKSLELVDLTANRRALKTFEDELEALRNPAPPADSRTVLYRLGREAAFGLNGTKLNARRGFDLLTQAAEAGSTDAKGALAVLYFDGCAATPPNFDEAFKLAKEASDAGDPWGQYVLGRCCREGLGAEKDATLAETQFKAARAGFEKLAATDALASTYFALCLYKAYGGGVNVKEASRRFREAADAGLPLAARWLGACYEYGCVEQDINQAFEWYRKGAEAGDGAAMTGLGNCYYNGRGVERDYAEAFRWYQKGAEAGSGGAMSKLGLCYEHGNGVTKNLDEAERWYRKAIETDPAQKDFAERGLERVKAARATQE
ncbi:MAG: sel1 repeat family protein, partial [Thermoguttaceae bacterium]|nr:sel1 repeat family protein [Thermoguttaceae bacterium]